MLGEVWNNFLTSISVLNLRKGKAAKKTIKIIGVPIIYQLNIFISFIWEVDS